MPIHLKRLLQSSAILGCALFVSACTTPTVSTSVSISSRFSLSPTLEAKQLRPLPDWGQTIAIVPNQKSKADNPTYLTIKEELQSVLYSAKLEPVSIKDSPDYKLTVDWSLKQSRIIEEYEEVPVMMPGPMIWHPRYGFGRAGMQTVWVTQVHHTPLYLRSLTLKLFEKNEKLPVYTATVTHESRCRQFDDAIPYLVRSAINNMYYPDGTRKVDTVEEITPICR